MVIRGPLPVTPREALHHLLQALSAPQGRNGFHEAVLLRLHFAARTAAGAKGGKGCQQVLLLVQSAPLGRRRGKGLPWWPRGGEPAFSAGAKEWVSRSGAKIPHASDQLSRVPQPKIPA